MTERERFRKRLEKELDAWQAEIRRRNIESMQRNGHSAEEIADFLYMCEVYNAQNREQHLDELMEQITTWVTRIDEHPDAPNFTTH